MALNQRSALYRNQNVGGTDLIMQEPGGPRKNIYGEEEGETPWA